MRTPLPVSRLVFALGLTFLAAGPARAADGPVDVEALYARAKSLLQAKQYEAGLEACWKGLGTPNLAEERRWSFLSGAAMAYEGLRQPINSLEMYHRLIREIRDRGAAAPEVWQKRVAQIGEFVRRFEAEVLEARGAVALDSTPRGALVKVDGLAWGPDGAARTPTTVYLLPGEHRVRLELAGRDPVELPLVVRAGLRDSAEASLPAIAPTPQIVTVPPPPAPAPAAERPAPALTAAPVVVEAPPVVPAPAVTEAAPSRLGPLWGWVLLGSGGVLAVAGVPFTALAFRDADALANASEGHTQDDLDRYNSLKSGVQTKQAVAGVLYGVGGALALGGATWLLVAHLVGDAPGEAQAGAVLGTGAVGVLPLPGGGVVTFGARF